MKLLERLADLPSNIKFNTVTSKTPLEDADYCFYHKSLMFYSCYFNNSVVDLGKKGKEDVILRRRKKKSTSNK